MNIAVSLPKKETDVVSGCIRGERWAQRVLYEAYYSPMMAVCYRYSNSKEDAEDIFQDGFIKILKKIHLYKKGNLDSWLKRIMINTALDHYRREIRRRTDDISVHINAHKVNSRAIYKLQAEEVMQLIQKLPPSYRTVFNLYIIEGYSHREIGEMLGIKEGTSRSHLNKARLKLKSLLYERKHINE